MNQQQQSTSSGYVLNVQITVPPEIIDRFAEQFATKVADQLASKLTMPAPIPLPASPITDAGAAKEERRLAYNLHEAADRLGVSYHSVLRLIKRGLIKPSVALRTKLISEKEIQRFLDETKI